MHAKKGFYPLTEAFSGPKALVIPGAYDALSAMLVQAAGYPAVYVGSYATAAAGFGLADVGVLTLEELARHAKSVSSAVSVPVIADAEGGFFDPANIWRTVRAFEEAGVSAIHIEDHAGGKHTDLEQKLVPLELMLQRLQAALDARRNPEFLIIARTDAIWATHDVDECVERLKAFASIGITHFFANGADPATLREIKQKVPGKYIVINLPCVRHRDEWDGAADLVIDYGFCLLAVTKALQVALKQYKSDPDADRSDLLLEDFETFERRLGYADFTERALRYKSNKS